MGMFNSLWCLMVGCTAMKSTDIYYRCYQNDIDHYVDIQPGNPKEIFDNLNALRPTKIFHHGWRESCHNRSAIEIGSAILPHDRYNYCCVDWSAWAHLDYLTAASRTNNVAEIVASDLGGLYDFGIRSQDLHLIGFSLGAQISGLIGKALRGAGRHIPKRITGLDPALPGFYYIPCITNCSHLEASDAEVVDVIHTDGKFYGVYEPTGKCDFYPNYGIPIQPGCPIMPDTPDLTQVLPTWRCSHDRAFLFGAEAFSSPLSHVGVKCDSAASFAANHCSENPILAISIDMEDCPPGQYFYSTNPSHPYGRGKRGIYPSDT